MDLSTDLKALTHYVKEPFKLSNSGLTLSFSPSGLLIQWFVIRVK